MSSIVASLVGGGMIAAASAMAQSGTAGDAVAAQAPAPTKSEAFGVVLLNWEFEPVVVSEDGATGSLRAVNPDLHRPRRVPGLATPELARSPVPPTTAQRGGEWFSSQPPDMASYLDGLNTYGTTCIEPNAVIDHDPFSDGAQSVKSRLAAIGFDYALYNTYTLTAMSNVSSGRSTLNAYNLEFLADWMVFRSDSLSGWLSVEFDGGAGIGFNQNSQSPQANIGSVQNPASVYQGEEWYFGELAPGFALMDGTLVIVAGLVDHTNYMDNNAYANTGRGQLINSAFTNSMVLPMTFDSLGINIAWQPTDWVYAMFGTGANNTAAGDSPFVDLSADNWSYCLEVGFISKDTFGLGPGTFRVQPFAATVNGATGGGLCFNVQQKLGKHNPLGFFGRFGFGDSDATAVRGAKAQAAAGLALIAPFSSSGSGGPANTEYLGFGAVWLQPAASFEPANNPDEYGFEVTYVMQLTPTMTLQPDLQVIQNAADGSNGQTNVIFQLNVNLTW